jgi:hypothetical protein
VNKDGSLTDLPLQNFKGSLLIFCPVPFMVLLKQGMEGLRYIRKPRNPAAVEIDETNELADPLHSHKSLPLHNVCNLLIIHFETFVANIDPEQFYLFLVEFTLLHVTE